MIIHVVNGPNLNMLGKRDPSIYGSFSYDQIIDRIKKWAETRDVILDFFQSNHEGEIIDYIQNLPGTDGIVINPGAFAHYSMQFTMRLKHLKVRKLRYIFRIYSKEKSSDLKA